MLPCRVQIACIVSLLSVSACSNAGDTGDDAGPREVDATSATGEDAATIDSDGAAAVTNFVAVGTFDVAESTGSIATGGCQLAYTLYEPATSALGPLVVLGHGFARSQSQMAGMAQHLASFGSRVATPEFCHLSAFDTDHEQNGRDAAALSAAINMGTPVLHAGQSAGGLAAVLAASQDENAVAALGLDLVDANDLALAAAAEMSVPIFGMAGESAQCNSSNNGIQIFQGSEQWVVRVNGATHCDFEDPTNGLCTNFCGGTSDALSSIRGLAAAFVSWQLNIDPSGEQWATPAGSEWQRLVGEGVLSEL